MVCDVLGGLHMMCEKKKKRRVWFSFLSLTVVSLFLLLCFTVLFPGSASPVYQAVSRKWKSKIQPYSFVSCSKSFFFLSSSLMCLFIIVFLLNVVKIAKFIHVLWPDQIVKYHPPYTHNISGFCWDWSLNNNKKKKTWSICCKSVMWCKSTC